jgi:hypothetical protein
MPILAQTTSGLNLRSAPGGAVLRSVPAGTEVAITGLAAEWLPVTVGAQSGFMSRGYLRPQSGAVALVVTAKALNLRAAARGDAAVRATLSQGAALSATGWEGDWVAVNTAAGAGFVALAYVGPAPAASSAPAGRYPDAAAVRAQRVAIEALDDEDARANAYEQLQGQSPYFSQRDNEATENGVRIETEGGRMCNLTALAMGLSYLGVDNPRPPAQFEDALEALRQENRLPARTETRGWGGVAQLLWVSCRFLLGGPAKKPRSWWESTVRPALRDGQAVILSISGHIVRMVGVGDKGLVIDDPYGHSRMLAGEAHSWCGKNGWRDRAAVVGRGILYPWAEVEVHTFRWVAALGAPGGDVSFSPEELPDLRDEEPSDPSAEIELPAEG